MHQSHGLIISYWFYGVSRVKQSGVHCIASELNNSHQFQKALFKNKSNLEHKKMLYRYRHTHTMHLIYTNFQQTSGFKMPNKFFNSFGFQTFRNPFNEKKNHHRMQNEHFWREPLKWWKLFNVFQKLQACIEKKCGIKLTQDWHIVVDDRCAWKKSRNLIIQRMMKPHDLKFVNTKRVHNIVISSRPIISQNTV